jgi:hypothetical protein
LGLRRFGLLGKSRGQHGIIGEYGEPRKGAATRASTHVVHAGNAEDVDGSILIASDLRAKLVAE